MGATATSTSANAKSTAHQRQSHLGAHQRERCLVLLSLGRDGLGRWRARPWGRDGADGLGKLTCRCAFIRIVGWDLDNELHSGDVFEGVPRGLAPPRRQSANNAPFTARGVSTSVASTGSRQSPARPANCAASMPEWGTARHSSRFEVRDCKYVYSRKCRGALGREY